MTRYCEVALGSPSARGNIIKLEELKKWVQKAQVTDMPLYRSYYLYDEGILEHFKTKRSVKNYKGNYYIDRIIFDIDKGSNKDDLTLQRAREFTTKLIDDWKLDSEHIGIWFSGSGYHITIPDIFRFDSGNQLPHEVMETMKKYFPEADFIYDNARIIRVGHTKNQKTGRYKIPLTYDELYSLTAEEVISLSSGIRKIKREVTDAPPPDCHSLIVKPAKIEFKQKENEDTTRIITCAQKMYNEGETPGSRHAKILRMASAFRRSGVPYNAVLSLMLDWAKTMDPGEVEHVVKSVFDSGFRFGCQDKLMSHYCDSKCIHYKDKNYTIDVSDSKMMEKDYVKFINTDFTGKTFDLADIYNLKAPFKFYPGEFVAVVGDTGLGKSAFTQNLAIDVNLPTLYLSLEMHQHLTYRRFVQIAHKMSRDQVEDYYRSHTNNLSKALNHILVTTTRPELDSIGKLIIECNPRIVVVDVIDAIRVKGMDMDSKLGVIGDGLKDIAQQTDTILFGIHHISKFAAAAGELTVHSGKGSSTIEQKADKVIGIEGKQTAPFRIVRSLKARDEIPFKMAMQQDSNTFQFIQVD